MAGDATIIHEPLYLVCDLIAFNAACWFSFCLPGDFQGSSLEGLDGLFDSDRIADDGVSGSLWSCQSPWWAGRGF